MPSQNEERLMTGEELARYTSFHGELVNGRPVPMPMRGRSHARLVMTFGAKLVSYAEATGRGLVLGGEAGLYTRVWQAGARQMVGGRTPGTARILAGSSRKGSSQPWRKLLLEGGGLPMHANTRGQIAESDWKLWRALSKEALERHCQKILTEAAGLENGGDSAHERYLKLYRLLQQRDQEIADVFNDPRRSRAYLQIARAVHSRIITRAELAKFSEDTQEIVELLAGGAG